MCTRILCLLDFLLADILISIPSITVAPDKDMQRHKDVNDKRKKNKGQALRSLH